MFNYYNIVVGSRIVLYLIIILLLLDLLTVTFATPTMNVIIIWMCCSVQYNRFITGC